ncbi:MAG: hypothetical protein Q4G04_04030 [bacterium]|nr:hypothetical protein [bacterium]
MVPMRARSTLTTTMAMRTITTARGRRPLWLAITIKYTLNMLV